MIGQVITGIEGDGLIGVNFKVTGNYDKLNYNVNPLSILTPGIIRSMFDSIFELNGTDSISHDTIIIRFITSGRHRFVNIDGYSI